MEDNLSTIIIGCAVGVIVIFCCLNCICVVTANKLYSICKRRKEKKRLRELATVRDREKRRERLVQREMRERVDNYNRSYSSGKLTEIVPIPSRNEVSK